MSETLNEYDDLLDGADHHWRNRLIGLLVLAALVGAGAYALWATVLGGGGSSAAGIQTTTVQRGSISKTFSTTGVAVAQSTANLSFGQSGTVTAMNVTLGQEVKQGDVLAEIGSEQLESAVTTAELNLASAQAKLDDLLAGPTKAELASADQSLAQAQGSYNQAKRALEDLLDGASESELRQAEQAVASAQSQLDKAEESRSNLYSASDDAVAAAEDAVAKAEDALANAQRTAANAADSIVMAKLSLLNAADTYCDTDDHLLSICANFRIPLTDEQVRNLINSIADEIGSTDPAGGDMHVAEADPSPTPPATPAATPEPELTETPEAEPTETPQTQTNTTTQAETGSNLVQATSNLISANTSYKNAVASKTSADNAVKSAEADLESAQNDLEEAKKGPSSTDIAAADVEVAAAQLALDEAKTNLNELKAGPTQDDIDDAQNNVNAASAALEAAKAKRDEVYAGATPEDIDSQRGQVQQAQLSVEEARKNLEKAKLIAPFDGTVASLSIAVGDQVTGGNSAVVLNTPDTVYLNLTVTESDITGLKAGQSGMATFDALSGSAFPITLDSVGTNPTTTQGVVTYQARARILTGRFASATGAFPSRVLPDRSAQSTGTPTPGATPTPAATPSPGATPSASDGGLPSGADTSAKPLPGMNASVTIILDQAQDVLIVPEGAIQTEGRNSVVEVQKDDGSTEKVTVQTGLSDGTNIEITSGLEEGQTVIIPTRAATSAQATQTAGTQQGGFRFFEGGGPPSGGGAGPSFQSAP